MSLELMVEEIRVYCYWSFSFILNSLLIIERFKSRNLAGDLFRISIRVDLHELYENFDLGSSSKISYGTHPFKSYRNWYLKGLILVLSSMRKCESKTNPATFNILDLYLTTYS